jgi:hypothetical protein
MPVPFRDIVQIFDTFSDPGGRAGVMLMVVRQAPTVAGMHLTGVRETAHGSGIIRRFTMFASRIALALGLLAATLPFERASAFNWDLPHSEDFCDTGWVLSFLKTRVDGQFRKYHQTKNFLVEIINPTLTYERKRDETHNVGRKFCHATVRMTDGNKHENRDMWYIVVVPWGFSGPPKLSGVDFCIAGLDPWHVYGKDCSTIRNSIGW